MVALDRELEIVRPAIGEDVEGDARVDQPVQIVPLVLAVVAHVRELQTAHQLLLAIIHVFPAHLPVHHAVSLAVLQRTHIHRGLDAQVLQVQVLQVQPIALDYEVQQNLLCALNVEKLKGVPGVVNG